MKSVEVKHYKMSGKQHAINAAPLIIVISVCLFIHTVV